MWGGTPSRPRRGAIVHSAGNECPPVSAGLSTRCRRWPAGGFSMIVPVRMAAPRSFRRYGAMEPVDGSERLARAFLGHRHAGGRDLGAGLRVAAHQRVGAVQVDEVDL